MDDGQCLLFHYPGVFDPTEAGYVRPVVKIELGARSDDWPHQEKPIQPYLAEVFPQLAMGATFPARVLAAERICGVELGHEDVAETAIGWLQWIRCRKVG